MFVGRGGEEYEGQDFGGVGCYEVEVGGAEGKETEAAGIEGRGKGGDGWVCLGVGAWYCVRRDCAYEKERELYSMAGWCLSKAGSAVETS